MYTLRTRGVIQYGQNVIQYGCTYTFNNLEPLEYCKYSNYRSKSGVFFSNLLVQLLSFNLIYNTYVMLGIDPLSPGPCQKPLIDTILKSAPNTIFTSFLV